LQYFDPKGEVPIMEPAGMRLRWLKSSRAVRLFAGNGLPATRVPCASRHFARSLNSRLALTREPLRQRSLHRKMSVMLGCTDASEKAYRP